MVWAEETVALAKVLQRCTVHSWMPLVVLCRAVQELHECLASVIQSSNPLDLGMLDVAEKDPVPPASEGRSPSLIPQVEPPIGVTVPGEASTLEPGEATQPEGLTLVPRQRLLPPPAFSLLWADESDPPPLVQAGWPMHIPQGAQLDFASLGSIQVTLSHFPAMGEVHCEYESQTVSLTWATPQSAQLEPLDQPDFEDL